MYPNSSTASDNVIIRKSSSSEAIEKSIYGKIKYIKPKIFQIKKHVGFYKKLKSKKVFSFLLASCPVNSI